MKSIANQYRDLKEGKMSQSNFMRNLRMSIPQYVTNVTSFNDAVRILKNKAILNEANVGINDEEELNAMIAKAEKEKEEEEAIKGGFGIQDPLEEDRTDDELNQAFLTFLKNIYAKSPTEKIAQMIADQEAKMGISKEEIPGFEGTRDELDSLSIREALNKDIRQFGQDLGKYLTNAGFKVKFVSGRASDADRTQVRTNMGLIILEADQNPSQQSLYLYSNPKEAEKIAKIVDKFQLTPYSGRVLTRGWTSKQVQGALNPGDIYKFEDKANGAFYFYRVAQVDTKVKDYTPKESLAEGRKKKEPKKELHPNQIHPGELRMGIRVEMEHTDDPKKAEKIALDHLAENPFYYTALKLSGIESPSAPKVKAPVAFKKEVTAAVELVDKANAMQKVKMPKIVKEARLNINGEPNAVVKQAMAYVDGPNANPVLKALSNEIEFQQTQDSNQALLRYDYWKQLPEEAIAKLKLQFNVEEDRDSDEDTGEIIVYRLTPKASSARDLGSSLEMGASKAGRMDAFREALEKLVREAIAETFDGRDNLANITDDTK